MQQPYAMLGALVSSDTLEAGLKSADSLLKAYPDQRKQVIDCLGVAFQRWKDENEELLAVGLAAWMTSQLGAKKYDFDAVSIMAVAIAANITYPLAVLGHPDVQPQLSGLPKAAHQQRCRWYFDSCDRWTMLGLAAAVDEMPIYLDLDMTGRLESILRRFNDKYSQVNDATSREMLDNILGRVMQKFYLGDQITVMALSKSGLLSQLSAVQEIYKYLGDEWVKYNFLGTLANKGNSFPSHVTDWAAKQLYDMN